jgi:hypothetical protein
MSDLSAPIVAHVPNSGIVHLPGRRFPGVVIQGDSLSQMFDDLVDALNAAKVRGDEDSYYGIFMVAERMQELLNAYEGALRSVGMDRPYPVAIADRTISDDFGA